MLDIPDTGYVCNPGERYKNLSHKAEPEGCNWFQTFSEMQKRKKILLRTPNYQHCFTIHPPTLDLWFQIHRYGRHFTDWPLLATDWMHNGKASVGCTLGLTMISMRNVFSSTTLSIAFSRIHRLLVLKILNKTAHLCMQTWAPERKVWCSNQVHNAHNIKLPTSSSSICLTNAITLLLSQKAFVSLLSNCNCYCKVKLIHLLLVSLEQGFPKMQLL